MTIRLVCCSLQGHTGRVCKLDNLEKDTIQSYVTIPMHESLMGKKLPYLYFGLVYTLFVLWVSTHWIELHAFITFKGKELCLTSLQRDVTLIHLTIDYESHLHFLKSHWRSTLL